MKIKTTIQTIIGYALQGLSLLSYLITIVIGLPITLKPNLIEKMKLTAFHGFTIQIINSNFLPLVILAFSITFVFIITNTIYIIKNGFKSLNTYSKAYNLCFLFSPLVGALYLMVLQDSFWMIILCVVCAFSIDILRRCRYVALRKKRALAKPDISHKALDYSLLKIRSRSIASPSRVPYLLKMRRPVFISYSHASKWAQRTVEALYLDISDNGIPCFLDKYNIKRGANWHRCLIENMDTAFSVICLVDELSINNPWPAAELETALKLRKVTGNPNTYLLVKNDFDYDNIEKLPIFEEVLKRAGSEEEVAFVLRETDNSPALISSTLKENPRGGQSNSLFAYGGSALLDVLRMPINLLTNLTISILWLPLLIALIVNHFTDFIDNADSNSSLLLFLAICFMGTICLIDVFSRGFIFMPNEKQPMTGILFISSFICGALSIWTAIQIAPQISLGFSEILMIFLSVAIASCSIGSIHENMVRDKLIVFGNEL